MKDINILAADTSGKMLTAAILKNDRLLALARENTGLTHSETFLPRLIELFEEANMTLQDIDLFSCVNGPGSFTGLRIGIASFKALAQVTKKPMAEVSALDGLYMSVKDECNVVCSMIDARREEVYAAVYKDGEKIFGDEPVQITDLAQFLNKTADRVLINGDGAIAYKDKIIGLTQGRAFLPDDDKLLQNAYYSGLCAFLKFKKGETVTYDSFNVNYIKPSQPEMKMKGKAE